MRNEKMLELNYKVRPEIGRKSLAKKLRAEGLIPGVTYGYNQKNVHIQVCKKELEKKFKSLIGYLITLKNQDNEKEEIKAFIKSAARHPVTDRIIHMDFLSIADMERPIEIDVTVKLLNYDRCVGIKMGGNLNIVKRRIKVLARPADVPRYIEIDIKDVNVGSSVRLSDVEDINNVKFIGKAKDIVILTIVGRQKRAAQEQGNKSSEA
ncbi:50S ribosomal protein L25 [Anaplasmataceae bacterium AB001_6]|nr:50S ribosomal protein L25 [Anaplasmataceae bacterium AB001_6]